MNVFGFSVALRVQGVTSIEKATCDDSQVAFLFFTECLGAPRRAASRAINQSQSNQNSV
jgi:hypothetical protein